MFINKIFKTTAAAFMAAGTIICATAAIAAAQTVDITSSSDPMGIRNAIQSAINGLPGTGGTVTVTGMKTFAAPVHNDTAIHINIPQNVTLRWEANYTNDNTSFMTQLSMFRLSGSGAFVMASGWLRYPRSSSGPLIFIHTDEAVSITVSGGEIFSSSGTVISSNSSTNINITGGRLETQGESNSSTGALYAITTHGDVTISGSTANIIAPNRRGINARNISVSGGTVSAHGYTLYSSSGTIAVTGGNVSSSGGSATTVTSLEGNISISGGSVTSTGSTAANSTAAAVSTSSGTIEISGGAVTASGSNGRAVYGDNNSTVIISGNAIITAQNREDGSIFINTGSHSGNNNRLYLLGGTINVRNNSIARSGLGTSYVYYLSAYEQRIRTTGSGNFASSAMFNLESFTLRSGPDNLSYTYTAGQPRASVTATLSNQLTLTGATVTANSNGSPITSPATVTPNTSAGTVTFGGTFESDNVIISATNATISAGGKNITLPVLNTAPFGVAVGTVDNLPPVPGGSGNITTGTITPTTIPLNWTQARDNMTAQAGLRYFVYRSSSNNIGTVANAESNGTLLNTGGTLDINTITATGLTPSTTYWFNVVVADVAGNKAAYTARSAATSFIAVTNITGVQPVVFLGTPLTLSGTVVPSNATNQTITWSVQSAGTTGATIISGNVLNAAAAGTVTVRATVVNGASATTNYTQDFMIVVAAAGGNVINMSDENPPESGTGWRYSGDVYTIDNNADVIVVGTANGSRRLNVSGRASATITLVGASITASMGNTALVVGVGLNPEGTNLTLILVGNNTLTGGTNSPGIRVGTDRYLTIRGDGSLTATGGSGGAGIGGNTNYEGGNITIESGAVTAIGGNDAAGIGGGQNGAGGNVTITGGTLVARAGNNPGIASAIGNGNGNTDLGTLNASGNWDYWTNSTANTQPSAKTGSGAFTNAAGLRYIRLERIFRVTFDPNGGSGSQTSALTDVNGKLADLPTPAIDGHIFDGWFTQASGGTAISMETIFAADATVYAQWTALPAPVITTTTLPSVDFNASYNQTLAATGTTPITWAVASGGLPTGLSLSNDGAITGTVTEAGTFSFAVKATNSVGEDTKEFSITVNRIAGAAVSGPPTVSESVPPTAYSITVNAVTAASGTQSAEYAISTESGISGEGLEELAWQPELEFTGLAPATDYYVFARTAGNDNYNAGEALVSAGISTAKADGATAPDYTAPYPLTAIAGATLESVSLPSGWVWDAALTTSAGEPGTSTPHSATFTPSSAAYGNVTLVWTVTVGTTSISVADRVLPGAGDKGAGEAAVVAPNGAVSGEFVAGPNVVRRGEGVVNFYYRGGSFGSLVSFGSLTVYDATGNVVRRVEVNGKDIKDTRDTNDGGRRLVGSWDLRDAKGRPVGEGAYLVRGSVTVNGKRERVSLVVSVR